MPNTSIGTTAKPQQGTVPRSVAGLRHILARRMAALLGMALATAAISAACGERQRQTDNLHHIQQQRSGAYIIFLLSDSGVIKRGTTTLTLEFRNAATHELAQVGNVQATALMPLGTSTVSAGASVMAIGIPGRYKLTADFARAGKWDLNLIFDKNQHVQMKIDVP